MRIKTWELETLTSTGISKEHFYRQCDANRALATKPDNTPYRIWQQIKRGYRFVWVIRSTNEQEPFPFKYGYINGEPNPFYQQDTKSQYGHLPVHI